VHLASVQTSLVLDEEHLTCKFLTSHYICLDSDSVITRFTHQWCLQSDNWEHSCHCDVESDSRSNIIDNFIQLEVCTVHYNFNIQILKLSICWMTSTDNVKDKKLKSSSLCMQVE